MGRFQCGACGAERMSFVSIMPARQDHPFTTSAGIRPSLSRDRMESSVVRGSACLRQVNDVNAAVPGPGQAPSEGQLSEGSSFQKIRASFRFPLPAAGRDRRPVQDADDLDAVGGGPVEGEVFLEALDTPDPQAFEAWIGRGLLLADAGTASDLLERDGGGIVEAEGDIQAGLAGQVGGLVVEVKVGGGPNVVMGGHC